MTNTEHKDALNKLTQSVIDRFSGTPDARLRQLMGALVRHLHAFAQETQLTEEEWFKAIRFLTEVGQTCTDTRQEFILLSDVLGLSMFTVELNHARRTGGTEATVFGPFHVEGAPHYDHGQDLANGAKGQPCQVKGSIRAPDGQPIAGAVIEAWQADADGLYDVQRPELDQAQARGVLHSRADGSFDFRSIVPEPYPIPTDGPVGQLLSATRRSPWRPAHLHFRIKAKGYETLVTHVFRRGDRYLQADPVFGVRDSLVADWKTQPDGGTLLAFDFVLEPSADPVTA